MVKRALKEIDLNILDDDSVEEEKVLTQDKEELKVIAVINHKPSKIV